MKTFANLPIWPHLVSTRGAIALSVVIFLFQIIGLVASGYIDGSLMLSGQDVGLFEHPGIFSIVVGDFLLFGLATYCSREYQKIGLHIPTTEPELVRRFFELKFRERWFGTGLRFVQIFLFFSFIGFLALINQSIKLFDAPRYYGHETFDSYMYFYSYCFNRVNLFISWCVAIPMFGAYLFAYTLTINGLFRRLSAKKRLSFYMRHHDQAGGYTFFGTLNLVFLIGLLVILIEIILLIYTHKKVAPANLFSIIALSGGFIAFTYLSLIEVKKALGKLEKRLKANDFNRFRKDRKKVDAYHLALHYNVKFSLYTLITEKVLLGVRLAAAVPSIYKLMQYSKIIF